VAQQARRGIRVPDFLPVLPLRDVVIFPNIITSLSAERASSIEAVERALASSRIILLVTQKDRDCDDPEENDLYRIGTAGLIVKTLRIPDGQMKVLVQGLTRARVLGIINADEHLEARVETIPELGTTEKGLETEALVRNVRQLLEEASSLGKNIPDEVLVIAQNLDGPGRLADLVASNTLANVADIQRVLNTIGPVERLKLVYSLLTQEIEVLQVQAEIATAAQAGANNSQREYLLRQQMKAIHDELGESSPEDECREYLIEADSSGMSAEALEEVRRNIKRLSRMQAESPEAVTQRTWIETVIALPWKVSTPDTTDMDELERTLDEDHHGLEKVKERILEFLAVRMLNKNSRGPVLCLVGPPGVGKTSIARSVANALGRKFVRIALGGVRDEAEIRGHRRTYVGAMPGRIIAGLKEAGVSNPVILLDEVDKISKDYRGDPAAALLEVIDPEHNSEFRDTYLGVGFDLSKVLFVATANVTDTIHPAFADRFEVVKLPGYTAEEKLVIAERHLISRQRAENGLSLMDIFVSSGAINRIVSSYTDEAGVRELEREIARICRKIACRHVKGDVGLVRVTERNIEKFLGVSQHAPTRALAVDTVGVATGLSVSGSGGQLLFIESLLLSGKGKLVLTGQLGKVMEESAKTALSLACKMTERLGTKSDLSEIFDLHVHAPEGATPKDGPSAGIALVASILSALTERAVRCDIAMTGEITLRGAVLAVGGIRDKVLAARRAGIRQVVLPKANAPKLSEIPKAFRRDLTFHLVDTVDQAMELVLAPVSVSIPQKKGSPRPIRRDSERSGTDHAPLT